LWEGKKWDPEETTGRKMGEKKEKEKRRRMKRRRRKLNLGEKEEKRKKRAAEKKKREAKTGREEEEKAEDDRICKAQLVRILVRHPRSSQLMFDTKRRMEEGNSGGKRQPRATLRLKGRLRIADKR